MTEAELLGFAIGPLEEMESEGAYWADEADDEDRVTPRMVIEAVERAIARINPRLAPHGQHGETP